MVFRLEPQGRPDQYVSHSVRTPKTYTRIVDCETYDCDARRNGWRTVLDVSDPRKREAAIWIRDHGARRFTAEMVGTVVTFTFPPGQSCFEEHRVAHRPGLYIIRDGDWRASTGRKHTVSERAWVDSLGEQTEKLAEIRARG